MTIPIITIDAEDNLKYKSREDLNTNFSVIASGVSTLETRINSAETNISSNSTDVADASGQISLLQSPSGNNHYWNRVCNSDIDFLTAPSGITLYTPPSGFRFIPDKLKLISDIITTPPSGVQLNFSIGTDTDNQFLLPSRMYSTEGIDNISSWDLQNKIIPEMTPIKMFITQHPTSFEQFNASLLLKGDLIEESYYV